MKICIFTETYYPVVGGGETQARLLAEGLITNGHSVIVLARRSDAALRQHENYGDVSVYRLAPIGSGQFKKWGLLLSSLPALVRLRDQYDLIFVSGYRIIGLTAVLAGKLFRKPVILKADSQGEMSGEFFESGLRKFGASRSSLLFRLFLGFRNVILKKADAFSAISSEIASEWISGRVPLNKIHLIPNSVDTTRFCPVNAKQKSFLREKLNLPQAATIAIYTGRLVSYKGLPLLLKVWGEIRCRHDNALLLLAGTGGLDIHNCENQLHDYVTSAGLEKDVWFLGSIQNIPEYLQAAEAYAALAGGMAADSAGRENAANVRGLWAALAGTPAQTVEAAGPVRVATTRDRANLVNVEVESGGQRIGFVYDTGANLSTVTESTAREMGFRMLEGTVRVGSVTGGSSQARVAVAPELRIGGATVRDAAFLVFPDSALAFPQISYQIRGIIGFPVIAGFGATTVTRGGELVLGDTANAGAGGEQNLCLRGLMPLVAAEHAGERLHFGFDTGAQTTALYAPFHAARRALVEAAGAPTAVQTGGAGGMRQVQAYTLSPLVLRIGGREATVPQVRVYAERTTDDSERLYGNIGQDAIRQFEAMTLDFRRMQLRFR